jgi:hypothetical protein
MPAQAGIQNWVPACAGTSGLRAPIRMSNSQASSPVFFAAPGTPSSLPPSPYGFGGLSSLPSGEPEGMERRAAQPSVQRLAASACLAIGTLATRRSIAAISVPGAVTSGRGRGPPGPPIRAAFAALRPRRVQPTEERSPIVGTDGDPRPPGSGVTSPARRRRSLPRPRLRLMRTPSEWGGSSGI